MRRFALCLLLAGCASGPKTKGPPPLSVALQSQSATITRQTLTSVQLTVKAAARSSQSGVVAQGAHWQLVFQGKVVASGEQKLGQALGGAAPTTLELVGRGQIAKDAKAVETLSKHRGGFSVALRGTVDFSGPGGSTAQAGFARATFLREPRMPQVEMEDVDASHYDSGQVRLAFDVGLYNPNPFPVKVVGFTYHIQINGQPVAASKLGTNAELTPSSKRVFEVDHTLTPNNFKGLEEIYRTNSMRYRMTGTLDVGLAKFDIDMGAPITFTR